MIHRKTAQIPFVIFGPLIIFVALTIPATAQCRPDGDLPAALMSCRNWITFSPPRPFNPAQNTFPTEVELNNALTKLFQEGWRGLVTYSLDGPLAQVPRIAKEVGFTKVIAGIF